MEELGTRFTNRKSENGNSLPKVLVRSVSIPLICCLYRDTLTTQRSRWSPTEKPLKRLRNDDDVNTGLKPGENEIEDFVGVGMIITEHPLHRSGRALL